MSVVFYVLMSVCHLVLASASNIISQVISCPGDVLTTECAIMGGGATVWQGTAFQCDSYNGEIVLRHSRFEGSYNQLGYCNNGAIIAQGLGVVSNSYISQLNVTVSLELNDTTVECWHDSGKTTRIIRSIQITVLARGKKEKINVKPPMYVCIVVQYRPVKR